MCSRCDNVISASHYHLRCMFTKVYSKTSSKRKERFSLSLSLSLRPSLSPSLSLSLSLSFSFSLCLSFSFALSIRFNAAELLCRQGFATHCIHFQLFCVFFTISITLCIVMLTVTRLTSHNLCTIILPEPEILIADPGIHLNFQYPDSEYSIV